MQGFKVYGSGGVGSWRGSPKAHFQWLMETGTGLFAKGSLK